VPVAAESRKFPRIICQDDPSALGADVMSTRTPLDVKPPLIAFAPDGHEGAAWAAPLAATENDAVTVETSADPDDAGLGIAAT
jgi:hypothetical protein